MTLLNNLPEPRRLQQLAAGIHDQEIDFDGGPLRYSILIPEGAHVAPLVISLHYAGPVAPYYGRPLVAKLFAPALAELAPVMIAPEARDGHGTTPGNMNAVL